MKKINAKKIFKIIVILSVLNWFSPVGKAQNIERPPRKAELYVQTGHSYAASSVSFSPDGKTLASASADNTIKLWSAETGQELRTLNNYSQPVRFVLFSPDGKILASLSGLSGTTLDLWSAETGQKLRTIADSVKSVAFSPDGKIIAGGAGNVVKLWNVETGKELASLAGHQGTVAAVAFSPDGKTLASGSYDKTVKLWSVETGEQLKTLAGHRATELDLFAFDGKIDGVLSVAFSSDGKTLASGGADTNIKLWNAETGQELLTLAGNTNAVSLLSFASGGKILASADYDKKIKFWNAETGQEIETPLKQINDAAAIAFSPDGKTIAAADTDKTIKILSADDGRQLALLSGHVFAVQSAAISPDGRTIAAGQGDQTIKIWNLQNEQDLKTIKTDAVNAVKFSPDGKIFTSADADGEKGGENVIKLWNTETGAALKTLSGHTASVYSAAFSPDGKTLASGSNDHTVKLWNVETGRLLRTLSGSSTFVEAVAFSPDGKILVSVSGNDYTFWQTETGRIIKTLNRLKDADINRQMAQIVPALFKNQETTADGRFQIQTWETGRLHLRDVKTGREATLVAIDENDWAAVTPDGLFDGSPNGWKKIAWRLGERLYDIAPVEIFFGEFFRPNLLQDIFAGVPIEKAKRDLSTIDIRQPAIKIQLAAAAPDRRIVAAVEITDAPADERQRGTTSGAQDLRLFRNGSLVKVWHGDVFKLSKADGCEQLPAKPDEPRRVRCQAEILLAAGQNDLTAYAFNAANVKSADAAASVEGKFPKQGGTLYVLAVGVNKYANPAYNLRFAVPDIADIETSVKQRQDELGADVKLKQYAKTEFVTLKDETATRENILLALSRFSVDGAKQPLPENLCAKLASDLCAELKTELAKIKPTAPEDALLVDYSGHGTSSGQRFYLLPHNFTGANGEQSLDAQGVSDIEINERLEKVDAGRLLMIVDACQSGQALGAADDGRAPMNSKGLAQLAYDKGMLILTATQSRQAALEAVKVGDKQINHGLLTYALLEAMSNPQADKDGNKQLWEREWFDYAVEQVPLLQAEAMKQRSVEIQATGRGSQLVYMVGDNANADPNNRRVQTPRVFYRRETETNPLIVSRP